MNHKTPSHGHDLVNGAIPALVRQLAVPAAVGFFFNTMYNVVDTYFAGRWSTEGLAALSLTFPVFFTLLAMSSGFSTGATAMIGHALGRDDRSEAACIAAQGLVLGVLLTGVTIAVGFAAAPSLYRILGAEGAYLELCLEYLHVILLGSGFILAFYMLNGVLNALGDTAAFRDYLMAATVVNMALDPWFMYGGLGVPALGVRGIALATIMAQCGGTIFLARRVWKTGMLWRSTGAVWRPNRRVLREIMEQGVPASLNMMTVAVGVFIITYFLGRFGQQTVAAYGAATRIEQIILLPALGLNVAALTLVARNAGAGKLHRVTRTVRTCLTYGAAVVAVGSLLMYLGANLIMRTFSPDPEVVAIGAHYLRIAAFAEYAYVVLFVNTALLQGLKKPAWSLVIGLVRQIVAPVLVFWLTTGVLGWGRDGVWYGVLIIAWVAAAASVVIARGRVHAVRKSGKPGAPVPFAAPGEEIA